jgi:UDP-N-acetyl-D-mannosaminuronate dehydrogenase
MAAMKSSTIRVGVAGLGEWGFRLVAVLGEAGFPVAFYDPDKTNRDLVRSGGASPALVGLVEAGQVTASTDEIVLHHVDVIIVADPALTETAGRQRVPGALLFVVG